MDKILLPYWFLQKLTDTSLLSLHIISRDSLGITVEVDTATAKLWRKTIVRGQV